MNLPYTAARHARDRLLLADLVLGLVLVGAFLFSAVWTFRAQLTLIAV